MSAADQHRRALRPVHSGIMVLGLMMFAVGCAPLPWHVERWSDDQKQVVYRYAEQAAGGVGTHKVEFFDGRSELTHPGTASARITILPSEVDTFGNAQLRRFYRNIGQIGPQLGDCWLDRQERNVSCVGSHVSGAALTREWLAIDAAQSYFLQPGPPEPSAPLPPLPPLRN